MGKNFPGVGSFLLSLQTLNLTKIRRSRIGRLTARFGKQRTLQFRCVFNFSLWGFETFQKRAGFASQTVSCAFMRRRKENYSRQTRPAVGLENRWSLTEPHKEASDRHPYTMSRHYWLRIIKLGIIVNIFFLKLWNHLSRLLSVIILSNSDLCGRFCCVSASSRK